MKVIINKKEIELEIANSFFKRLKGLMFKNEITKALRIKTNNIHTFFMKTKIDVIMTDKNNRVLYFLKNLDKGKIIIKRGVYYTYEFPSNFIENISYNDILVVKE